MKEQGATLTRKSSEVCPDCVAIDVDIWKLYHEILRVKPHLSNLDPAEVMRKLWNAYMSLAKK